MDEFYLLVKVKGTRREVGILREAIHKEAEFKSINIADNFVGTDRVTFRDGRSNITAIVMLRNAMQELMGPHWNK